MMKMKNVWIAAMCFVLVSSILVKGASEKVSIEGVIAAIDSAALQITVGGTIVQVTPNTEITITSVVDGVKEVTPVLFEDLGVGMTVKVCGQVDDLNVLNADKVNVKYDGAISE